MCHCVRRLTINRPEGATLPRGCNLVTDLALLPRLYPLPEITALLLRDRVLINLVYCSVHIQQYARAHLARNVLV